MIDLNAMNEWQYRCPDTGLVYPWYTKPALDLIATWPNYQYHVLELGGGASTLWWDATALRVITLETNADYITAIEARLQYANNQVIPFNLKALATVVTAIGPNFDVVIVDGIDRDACVPHALNALRSGGRLIVDNWLQPSVWVAIQATQALIAAQTHTPQVYKQPGHPDWQTAIFTRN